MFCSSKGYSVTGRGNDTDQSTLNLILSKPDELGPFQYQSTSFLGKNWRGNGSLEDIHFQKNWLLYHIPLSLDMKRTARLYDVTCKARGEYVDPLSMYLVPASEYVNAVHFQSDTLLETFVQARPHHALSQLVARLVLRALSSIFKWTISLMFKA
ncbi:uncharacterized protein TNCV_298931 [Trichonephila clavipes]|nr:uncharacterized protein TNCV_298931 [Trichonephila clavipes]